MGLSGERDSDSGSGRDLRVVCLSLVQSLLEILPL